MNEELNSIVKTFADAKWSKTHRCWHIANNRTHLKELFRVFKGKAYLNTEALFADKTKQKTSINHGETSKLIVELNHEHVKKINEFKDWLRSSRYADNTIKTYTEALRTFLKFYHNKAVNQINNEDIIHFNNEYILRNGFSASFQNQVINAIKLFFRKIENTPLDVDLIHRPKREKKLPNVLSKEEIKAILEAPSNIKHKAMLSLIYACGLRRSEALNLKIPDIDSKRHLLTNNKKCKGQKRQSCAYF